MCPTRRALALVLSTAAAGTLLVLTPTVAQADDYHPTNYTHHLYAWCMAHGNTYKTSGAVKDYTCRLDSGTPLLDAIYRLWVKY
ncbi:hypothetical protein ABT061_22655 [Streptosporangium sp. NPDC002544]|uniref:hypothetical protein n=1 Tax=Streptosporangium sp. NPDC002544 TaxID=3154538 RepID=UPI00331A9E41